MKKVQQGFTLIELMIVVAIIGILAAIAIPQYQNYTARAQMSEAMTLTSGLKTTVAEIWSQLGDLTVIDSGSHGIPAATDVNGNYVAQVAVADGVITATMKATGVANGIQSATLTLEPNVTGDGSIVWSCTSSAEQKFLPASCTKS